MERLDFVRFSELQEWSVLFLSNNCINYSKSFPLKQIGLFLNQTSNSIVIQDSIEYRQITVKTNNGGLVLRDTKLGKDIGTKKQNIVHAEQFLMSRIDARNGAFGIVPKSLSGAVVTNDFPIFDVKTTEINPQYLLLLTTTEQFKRVAQNCSSGTTNRQRIDVKKFLTQKIPLPTLEQQNAIVGKYNQSIAEAQRLEVQAAKTEAEIEKYLMEELGVYVDKRETCKGLNFINFSDLGRWDVQYFSANTNTNSRFKLVNIGNCLDYFMEGMDGTSIRMETYKHPNEKYYYIGMESVEKNSGLLQNLPSVMGKEIKSQTLIVPKEFIIYGKLRPYLNKYWYNDMDYENIVCSSEFFVFHVKPTINNEYFRYVLSSNIVQKQISELTSGARMPRINEKVFNNIQIPLPPLSVQDSIVAHVSEMKERVKNFRQEAKVLRQRALEEFEGEVFE